MNVSLSNRQLAHRYQYSSWASSLGSHSSLDQPQHFRPGQPRHDQMFRPLDARQEQLKSRRPFVTAAPKLLGNASELDVRVDQRTDFTWNLEYLNNPFKLHDFIKSRFRSAWLRRTRLRTGVGVFVRLCVNKVLLTLVITSVVHMSTGALQSQCFL